jgi:PAS domain S-box-containing protein
MKILVVSNSKDDHSFGAKFLEEDYPDAERVVVADREYLLQALLEGSPDLVLASAHTSWIARPDLVRTVQQYRPGLPVLLLSESNGADSADLNSSLRQNYQTIGPLLNTPNGIILIFDIHRKILLANESFYRRSGKTPEEVCGRTLFDILPLPLAEKRDAMVQQVLETGAIVRFEDYGVDGWLDSTIFPIVDQQGQIILAMAYAHDITGRKNIEEDLRQSHKTIDALLNAPMDIIIIFDRQGTFYKVNQTFCRRFAKSPEEVIGHTVFEVLPPEQAQRRIEILKQVFESKEILRFEDQGLVGWFDHSVYPILDEQNQVAYVAVISRDINEQKSLEEVLRRDQRTMLAMANAPNDIFVLLDLSGKILMTNEVMAKSLGRQVDEIIGQCFWDLLPKPVAEFRRGVFERVVLTGMPERADDKGRFGIYDSRVIPIHNDAGKVVQVAIIARDITERIKTELSLKASEERYRTLIETSPDGIAYQDLQGNLLFVNQQFAALFGYDQPEEIYNAGINGADLIAERDLALREEKMQSVWQDGAMRGASFTAHRIDGSLLEIEVNGSVVKDPEGKPTGIITICRDVTERKKMEVALVESEKRYRSLIETSPDGIIFFDLKGRPLIVNQQCASLFGYESIDEFANLDKKFADLITETDRPRLMEAIQAGLKNINIRDLIITAQRKDGSLFQLEANSSLVYGSDRKILGVLAVFRDITDQKQMELALKASEEKYRKLIETSPDGIAYQDIAGKLLFVNQQFAQLFGFEGPEEIYKLGISDIDLVADPNIMSRPEIMRKEWQNSEMRNVTFTVHRKDGSKFQVEVNGSLVYDPEGEPTGVITICRDVTERILIQQELARTQENLERRVIERTAELEELNRQLQNEVSRRKEAEDKWKRHALHSEALAEVASRANSHLEINAVLETICDEVIRAIPFSICSINLYHEQDDSLHIAGYASNVPLNFFSVPPTPRPIFEEFIRQFGGLVILPDVSAMPETAFLANATSPNVRTLVVMPFYHKDVLIGSLNLASVGEIRLPTAEELDLLRAISDQSALSITNARLFERVSDDQARLKILTERLVEVQEEEKRRLARELHDEIGQMLTSLSLNLEIVSRSVEAEVEKSSIRFELEATRWQVKQLLDEVRDLSLNLLPAMLEDLGLLPTLLDYCQRYTSQTGIQVNLSHRGLDKRVPPQVEIAAYRIVQEGLTNAARYAGVNEVDVRLWTAAEVLGVQIEDQGIGFDLPRIESEHRSHGISGMRERAANCSGNLEIDTNPGKGTCLTVEFPLTQTDQDQEVL